MQAATATNNINAIPLKIEYFFENTERKQEPGHGFFEFPDFSERKAYLLREIDDYGQEKMRQFMDSASDLHRNSEPLMLELEQMRRRFGYEHANMLEKIFINQVLCSWLKLKLFEMQETNDSNKATDLSFGLQLRQAQAQFTGAYDALLKVKKLLPEFECI
jgi:hypothetical protein